MTNIEHDVNIAEQHIPFSDVDVDAFLPTIPSPFNSTYSQQINRTPNKNSKSGKKVLSLQSALPYPSSDHSYSYSSCKYTSYINNIKEKHEKIYHDVISDLPIYSCCSCKKFHFNYQCPQLTTINDKTDSAGIHLDSTLCYICHKAFSANKFPVGCESINNLAVDDLPDQLKVLTPIDRRFVTKLHTFMTLLVLPKG